MGLVKRFVEMVKSGYPEFDPINDSVEIEFEGGGDSFGSFSYISVYPSREGELDLNESENQKLLLDIIDAAGVSYNWNEAGTTGNIKYNEEGENELAIYTMLSIEDWGRIEEGLDHKGGDEREWEEPVDDTTQDVSGIPDGDKLSDTDDEVEPTKEENNG